MRLVSEPPDARDHVRHLLVARALSVGGKPAGLLLQISSRERLLRVACRGAYPLLEAPAIAQGDRHTSPPSFRIRGIDVRVEHHTDLVVKCPYPRIAQRRVGEVGEPRPAVESDERKHEPHGELRLVNRSWIG